MNNSNNNIEDLMDKYLLGQLTQKELDMLEHQLSNNPELASQLKQDTDILSGIQSYGNQQLKQKLKTIHKEVILNVKPEAKIRRMGFSRLVVAASIVILIAAGMWFFLNPAQTVDIYAANYEPYSNISLVNRGEVSPTIADAETYYQQGQYAQALPILENELTKPDIENADQIRLAAGICEMELGNFQNAISYFQPIIEVDNPLIVDQAIWYSALANVKLGNVEAARSLFEILAGDAGRDYSEEAKVILSSIK